MPMLRFALQPGGPRDVEVRLEAGGPFPEVQLRGQPLARVEGDPAAFALPEGGRLTVAVDPDPGSLEPVQVFRDGERLVAPAAKDVRGAIAAVVATAVLLAVLGAAGVTRGSELLRPHLGVTLWPALAAATFAVLAGLTYRRSRAALGVAIAIVCLDGALSVTRAVLFPGQTLLSPIVLRVLLLLPMARGLAGLNELAGKPGDDRPVA